VTAADQCPFSRSSAVCVETALKPETKVRSKSSSSGVDVRCCSAGHAPTCLRADGSGSCMNATPMRRSRGDRAHRRVEVDVAPSVYPGFPKQASHFLFNIRSRRFSINCQGRCG
jgi:hypothetical protein